MRRDTPNMLASSYKMQPRRHRARSWSGTQDSRTHCWPTSRTLLLQSHPRLPLKYRSRPLILLLHRHRLLCLLRLSLLPLLPLLTLLLLKNEKIHQPLLLLLTATPLCTLPAMGIHPQRGKRSLKMQSKEVTFEMKSPFDLSVRFYVSVIQNLM